MHEMTLSPPVLSGSFSESEIRDFSETVDNGELADDYGYLSDSDLEEDWDFESLSPQTPPSKPRQQDQDAPHYEYKEHPQMGRVIKIQDVAFITCVHPKSIFSLSQLEIASKRFCFTYTPVLSGSRHLDLKKIASQGVLRLPGHERVKYPGHHRNRSIDWQTRFPTQPHLRF